MKIETFDLWNTIPGDYSEIPTITAYTPQNKAHNSAIVIFPGGGYCGRAKHEGDGYARFFAENGITAFVVAYRVAPHRFPTQLFDARRAVKFVRFNSEKYGIDKNKIAVMGSSAGGHLAALVSVYTNEIDFDVAKDEIENEEFLPNAQILCYPVIEMTEPFGHVGSGLNLLGEDRFDEAKSLTPSLIATKNSPKAFIWHTFADGGVSVVNSLHYAEKLKEVGGSVEMHIFPDGHHGIGLCTGDINDNEKDTKILAYNAKWGKLLLEWLEYINF